jgi:hypothetical protein
MQATVHTSIQLAPATPKDKLSVFSIANFALKLCSKPTGNSLKFFPAAVVTFVRIAELSLNLDDTTLAILGPRIHKCFSINKLFRTVDKVGLYPEFAFALARGGPFGTTPIAELCTTAAPSKPLVQKFKSLGIVRTSCDCNPIRLQLVTDKRSTAANGCHLLSPTLLGELGLQGSHRCVLDSCKVRKCHGHNEGKSNSQVQRVGA